jgi:hypothetical protein
MMLSKASLSARALDPKTNFKELARFDVPESESFHDADASAGLVFTKSPLKPKWNPREEGNTLLLTCWKL